MIAGLLLAGGRSSRFGSEKAVFALNGGLMMDAPLSALTEVCVSTAVSARPGSAASAEASRRGLTCLHDSAGTPEGPLAGVHAGLEWAIEHRADWLVTAPCDAPSVSVEILRALIKAGAGTTAAVARSPRGIEPLLALWPTKPSLSLITAVLEKGEHPPVRHLLDVLKAVETTGYDGLNVNTLAEIPAWAPKMRADRNK